MDVRLSLVQMIGKTKDGSRNDDSEKELVLKQKLCVELMDVINVISPGKLAKIALYISSNFNNKIDRNNNRNKIPT